MSGDGGESASSGEGIELHISLISSMCERVRDQRLKRVALTYARENIFSMCGGGRWGGD